jgi:hypothetical protein
MPLGKSPNNPLLQTVEYKHFGLIRSIRIGVLICEIVLSLGVMWFLYTKTYAAVDDIQTVVLLKEYSTNQTVPFDTLDKLEKMWENRHTTTLREVKRNPFIQPKALTP